MPSVSTAPAAPRQEAMFGICRAVGEDFGFNPLWLRVAFGVGLLVNLEYVIGAYVALGVIVVLSRLLAPNPRQRAHAAASAQRPVAETQDNEVYPALDRAA